MYAFLQDVRYALRTLRRSPAFTLVALLTLALGIGANTAIFSAVNAVLLRPLPYPEPERIVRVFERGGVDLGTFSPPNFVDVRTEAASFEALAAYHGTSYALTGEGPAQQLAAATTTAGLFEALGVRPVLGRGITAADAVEGADRVVVLGHGLWQRRFGGNPGVVGQSIVLDGESYQVIGVMPEGFAYPAMRELWTPLAFSERNRGAHYLSVIGRLRPGIAPERAEAEVDAVMARLAAEYSDTNEGIGGAVRGLHEYTVGDVRPALLILLGAVGFVLLIACVNVANLLLARAVGREREIAVRIAMGAAPRRLVRLLLTESMLLALAGGAAGLLIALWGGSALSAFRPDGIPRLDQASVDLAVLGFAFAASLLTGVLFGLLPALKAASRIDLNDALKDGGRGALGNRSGWRLRFALIASEMALAVLLLVGAGLLFELSPTDPLTYVLVAAVLAAVALLATWLPARRAARVDPMEALRHE